MHTPFARPARIEPAEWEARVQLAACYRIFDLLGWTEMIYNHLSLRVPVEPGPLADASRQPPPEGGGSARERPIADTSHFLINPFGLHYREVTASNLVKVDAQGRVVGHSDWPINPAGFTFHGAIHATLPDAHCVMHVHTTPTMAVCCLEEGLSFTNFYAAQLWGQVAYHDFEGITVHLDEGQRILASATVPGADGQAPRVAPVLLLRNHGPVVIGRSLPQALGLMWLVQRACEVQLASMSMGACRPIPVPVMARCVRDSLNFNPNYGAGQDVFDAMQRQVDAIDPGYRR